jgi:hypothetical protein
MTVQELFDSYSVFRSKNNDSKAMFAVENEVLATLIYSKSTGNRLPIPKDTVVKCFYVIKESNLDSFHLSPTRSEFNISDLKSLMLKQESFGATIMDSIIDFFN